MSRDIKFRLYDKEIGEMEYLGNADIFRLCKSYPNRYELMQYTGLEDKNEEEIYEGDIVEGHFNPQDTEDYIFLGLTETEKRTGTRIFIVDDIWFGRESPVPASLEVIGNIYQDPELATPPQDLDDAINLFKGYMADENHFDEIDFKTWLYDVWLVEEKKK